MACGSTRRPSRTQLQQSFDIAWTFQKKHSLSSTRVCPAITKQKSGLKILFVLVLMKMYGRTNAIPQNRNNTVLLWVPEHCYVPLIFIALPTCYYLQQGFTHLMCLDGSRRAYRNTKYSNLDLSYKYYSNIQRFKYTSLL